MPGSSPRVAIFGLLGSGNLGNHGSLDAMLQFIRAEQPDADITCVCADPLEMKRQYGLPSIAITWYDAHASGRSRFPSIVLKAFGKFADAVRTFRWVRRFDVVIVPGMGVLEATLPIRPWGFPYALFLMSFWGRLTGTKVALVSVGANPMRQPVTRWFIRAAARLASYRSYRDSPSLTAIRQMGVDTSRDQVFPDLAFAVPTSPQGTRRTGTVGVGVMAYSGTYLDRLHADEIYTSYVGKLISFVLWLIDNGYRVQLFTGDPADEATVSTVTTEIRRARTDLADRVVREHASSFGELMRQMSAVDVVVASRYHNVLAALKLAKPTISISYAAKNDVLMADMGMAEFCQSIRAIDVPQLIEQFRVLAAADDRLSNMLREQNARNMVLLDQQNAALSAILFAAHVPAGVPAAAGSD